MWDIRNREGVGIIRQYLTDDDDNSVRKHEMNNNFMQKAQGCRGHGQIKDINTFFGKWFGSATSASTTASSTIFTRS